MSTRTRSARERAYEQLRRRILTLELAPSQRLDENRIAEELGVSRTPVREAFHQLSAEGLVDIVSRGGYVVADMNLHRFRELIEAQHILVRAVTHLLIARATDEDLEQLEEAVRTVDSSEQSRDPHSIAEANATLHILEARLAGNDYLLAMAERVHTHLQRLAFLSFGGAGGIGGGQEDESLLEHYKHVHEDHWHYLEALRSRDASTAEKVGVSHVELFQYRIRKYLEANAVDSVDFSSISR
ncbi:GntR family transcriptional regulator [Corynebacterium sp. L4756]|uniref:GntR family transcriptional regulator n=1 Tax=unclassified Corynebacterium TaxID=2624378 RepID=UPI00374DC199